MKPISKLGIGPMSEEIIEAVYKFSRDNSTPLMLIASKNQIDWNGGYVNGWTTDQFAEYAKNLKNQYPESMVYICRDHCGPGFKGSDINDTYKTIDSDLKNGFDLIHIDFCHFPGTKQEILDESKKAIEYIKSKSPDTMIEIGTDENTGTFLEDTEKIEEEMKFFSDICQIDFFVCQTGSLIKEINQVGKFNHEFIKKIRGLANKYYINLKEHNADYLNIDEIKLRKGLIDALNIAPQYGVIQTKLTLQKCLTYGIDFTDFVEEAYRSNKWKKWLHSNTLENKFLCSVIAGHYNFSSDTYKKIYEEINKYENFRNSIINEIEKNIAMYNIALK